MTLKDAFGAVAVALTVLAYLPYLRAIVRGKIRPHVFSWVIWSATTLVVFAALVHAGAGAGAWPTGVSGVLTLAVAVLAFARRADTTITRADWAFLAAAGASLPWWYVTANPLWAVVILTTVDVLGFGPTVRKSYRQPHEEHLVFFGLVAASNVLVLLALERYAPVTVLFPAAVGTACTGLIVMVGLRRRAVPRA